MDLRILAECVTVAGKFADVVDAYYTERRIRGIPTEFMLVRHPTENYSLEEYGNFPVVALGSLMSSVKEKIFQQKKQIYQDGCRLQGSQLRKMNKNDIYFRPNLIQWEDRRLLWQRNDDLDI